MAFRDSDDLADLQSWFEGDYAYWNVGAIASDCTEDVIAQTIALFVTENLGAK